MKNLCVLFLLFISISLKAQTECIEIIAVPAELKVVKEKVLKKAAVCQFRLIEGKSAVYGYRLIGGKPAVLEEVTEVIQPSYTHVYTNLQNEKCKEIKPAITATFMKVISEAVDPKIERYLISDAVEPKVEKICTSEAEYEIITKIILIKDGSLKTYNKKCY